MVILLRNTFTNLAYREIQLACLKNKVQTVFFFNPREHTGTNCIQKGQPECHTKSLMNQFFNSMQLRKWRISSRSLSSNQGTKLDYYKG